MNQLLVERLTGAAPASPQTPAMRWGSEQEGAARAAYSFRTDRDALLVGFVDHPRIAMSGASPDGLVGNDGLVEIKCPTTATHLDVLGGGDFPSKYAPQVQWQLACTGREWCDFVSFDPRLPEAIRVFIRRVERDDVLISALERQVFEFLEELADKAEQLKNAGGRAPVSGGHS